MAIRYRLRDLNMDEVSHVPEGDNPHARVLLTKSRQRTETHPMTNSIDSVAVSPEDRKAMELAKMAAGRPELAERLQKQFEAALEPEPRQHPLSKAAEESPAFAALLPWIEEEMIKGRVDHETAIGRVATNPGLYPLVEAYREEQGR
jgi:predicted Ser/Thr protein kinase